MTYWIPTPKVIVLRVDGVFVRELIPPYLQALELAVAAGQKPHLFSDWVQMTGFDGEVRDALTVWMDAHAEVAIPHICVRSAVVSMGVNIANLVLGNSIEVVSNQDAFYDTIRALLPPELHLGLARFGHRHDDGFTVQASEIA